MSIFYLEVGDEFYTMNATTSITRTSTGQLSDSLQEDGNYSADNYVVRPVTLNFSGIITSIKNSFDINRKAPKTPKEYLDGLKSAQINKLPITVHYSDIQAPDSNCYFTSFSHTQDSTFGNYGNGQNSFQVKFSLSKVRFAKGATIVARPAGVLSNKVGQVSEKSTTTKEKKLEDLTVAQRGYIKQQLSRQTQSQIDGN